MSEWVPESERSTAWYLFNKLFKCSTPYMAGRDVGHIKQMGAVTTGDAQRDKDIYNSSISKMLTIARMAELHQQGVPVRVPSNEDAEIIYRHVEEHLLAWLDRVQTSLNPIRAPIQDLIVLDKFAGSLFEHARYVLTNKYDMSSLFEKSLAGAISRDTLVECMVTQERIDEIRSAIDKRPDSDDRLKAFEEQLPTRDGMGDAFTRVMANRQHGCRRTTPNAPATTSAGRFAERWGK